jgi:fumarylacetoacetase
VAIGDQVIDLAALFGDDVFAQPSLNAFLARGRSTWAATRSELSRRLAEVGPFLFPLADVRMHLPIEVADFVDFYSSLEHATNAGRILRPGEEPLKPNWRHLPVGYHGRSGTIVVSGTPVRRPWGQWRPAGQSSPILAPTERLDFEAEVGFVVGVGSEPGRPVPLSAFADHVFGVVLLIDWSARDIQSWETVPLGPFLGKSFATSISPWVVPLDALDAARIRQPAQEPPPLSYLTGDEPWGLDLQLEVALNGAVISRPPFGGMYWTAAQQLAHLTVNGASIRTGDLYGSGTVSGPSPDQYGSMLELAWNGEHPLDLPDGSTRSYLLDGDRVIISASAPGPDGTRLGLGQVTGTIRPAQPEPPGG